MKRKWSITLWVMIVFPLLIGVIGLVILPDQIPAHYNGVGEITRWGSKYECLIWAGLFALINLALLLVCKYFVRKKNTPSEKRLVLWTSFGGMLVLDALAVLLLCVTSVSAREIPPVSELPLIEAEENLLSYEKGRWPLFYRTPESVGEPHPFDGKAAFNAFEADLNSDGQYEAYATIHLGSGIVTSYLLGYDPVSESTYMLDGRMVVDYEFVGYEGGLYLWATQFSQFLESGAATQEGLPSGVYRPKLNDETLSFDLERIDPELAETIEESIIKKIE